MTLENYPGAKTGSGIVQWLINNTPVHRRYFELFAGSAQLYRSKKEAKISILADINNSVCNQLQKIVAHKDVRIFNKSYIEVIETYRKSFTESDFIYLDPPYPFSARRSGKVYYKHEMLEDDEHLFLLSTVRDLQARVMISTRQNRLYDLVLHDWRKDKFQTSDRAGRCEEIIYMNYEKPAFLHQYDYVGNGFTDRQRVKRKIKRFAEKITMLPEYEKHLFIMELVKIDTPAVKHFLTMTPGTDDFI